MHANFRDDFRRFFVRGLAAVLPTVLTLVIIVFVFRFIHRYIGVYINAAVIYVLDRALADVSQDRLWQIWHEHWYLQSVGFILAIVGIYFIGRFVASFIGRSIWSVVEHALIRAPVIKQIYPSAKQVTDFLLSEKAVEFSRVVAVEYPRKGIWSVGLVTGTGIRALAENLASELLTVFIPSSPTPMTGYTITVKRGEVIDLPLSFDEALRFTVSGGVLVSPSQRMPGNIGRGGGDGKAVGQGGLGKTAERGGLDKAVGQGGPGKTGERGSLDESVGQGGLGKTAERGSLDKAVGQGGSGDSENSDPADPGERSGQEKSS